MSITTTTGLSILERNRPLPGITNYRHITNLKSDDAGYFSNDALTDAYYFDDAITLRYVPSD